MAACPFKITLNSRGFTQILHFASEGTALLNSLSALMTGQLKQIGFRDAGAASLIPSFASFRIWFIHPLIQSNFKGTCRRRSVYPLRFMKHLLLLPYILIASKVTCLSCIPASPITRNLQGHRKRPGSPFGAWSLCCHVVKGSCSSGGRISLSGCDMSLIYCFE